MDTMKVNKFTYQIQLMFMSFKMSKFQKLPLFFVCENLQNICFFGREKVTFSHLVKAWLLWIKISFNLKLTVIGSF